MGSSRMPRRSPSASPTRTPGCHRRAVGGRQHVHRRRGRGNAPPAQPDELTYEIRGPGTWNPSGERHRGLEPGPSPCPAATPRARSHWLAAIRRRGRWSPATASTPVAAPRRCSPAGRLRETASGRSHGLAVQRRERTITDGAVPAAASPALWLIWQADEWGRWSGPVEASAEPPPRPHPAPPVVEPSFLEADRDAPPGLRPPGTLRIAVRVRGEGCLGAGGAPDRRRGPGVRRT